MDSSPSLQQILILIILLIMSAFFSISETALTSLTKLRLRNMIQSGVKGTENIEKILNNPKKLITSILLGNNLANIGSSVLATAIAIKLGGNNSLAISISTAILTIVILIFCEITPKIYASQSSEKISLLVARPIRFFVFILTPFVYIITLITNFLLKLLRSDTTKPVPLITEEELKSIVNVSHEEGVIEQDDKQIINNVFGFGDSKARDVMTPRTDLTAISIDTSYNEVKDLFKQHLFSKIPVFKDTKDSIVGTIHLKDFIFYDLEADKFELKNIIRKPFFTYEYKSTKELFSIMKKNSISISIVLDEYGGTAGIVTLRDLVEEIVGEINDEYDDDDEDIEIIQEHEYIVEGSTKIDDVNEMLGTKLESEDFDSIGGYVIGVIGHIPLVGYVIEHEGLTFKIEEIEKNRIEKLRIHT